MPANLRNFEPRCPSRNGSRAGALHAESRPTQTHVELQEIVFSCRVPTSRRRLTATRQTGMRRALGKLAEARSLRRHSSCEEALGAFVVDQTRTCRRPAALGVHAAPAAPPREVQIMGAGNDTRDSDSARRGDVDGARSVRVSGWRCVGGGGGVDRAPLAVRRLWIVRAASRRRPS